MFDFFRATQDNLFGEVSDSVPIKAHPYAFRRLVPERKNFVNITTREATALLIATKAQNRLIENGAVINRCFALADGLWGIENGCGQDIVASHAAGLIPAADSTEDRFVISEIFSEWLSGRTTPNALTVFFATPLPVRLQTSGLVSHG